jgi:hypothetical protein
MFTPHSRVGSAMHRVSQAERRGDLQAARAWLDVAERCLRIDAKRATTDMRAEKHAHWRKEAPHHLKSLELRSRFPR